MNHPLKSLYSPSSYIHRLCARRRQRSYHLAYFVLEFDRDATGNPPLLCQRFLSTSEVTKVATTAPGRASLAIMSSSSPSPACFEPKGWEHIYWMSTDGLPPPAEKGALVYIDLVSTPRSPNALPKGWCFRKIGRLMAPKDEDNLEKVFLESVRRHKLWAEAQIKESRNSAPKKARTEGQD